MRRGNAILFSLLGLVLVLSGALLYVTLRRPSAAQPPAEGQGLGVARNFSLLDLDGRYFELYRQRSRKALVLVTYGVGCPIIEKNLPLLETLAKKYEPLGIGFLLIDPNPQDSPAVIRKAIDKFGISLAILRDERQSVARSYGFTRTSEALLVRTADWATLYRGAIDDRLTYGSDRAAASHAWLEDALGAFLRGQPVALPRTQPDGCLIQRVDSGPPPTFTGSVAAILRRRCNNCHAPGGRTRPDNLVRFEDIKGWASMIEETILTRRMPPWEVDPHYGRFEDDLSLSPAEERTLLDWIRAGMPRGEGPEPAPPDPGARDGRERRGPPGRGPEPHEGVLHPRPVPARRTAR